MRVRRGIVIFATAVGAAAQAPDEGWSAVPASAARDTSVALVIPAAPGPESIRLVGPGALPPPPESAPRHVVAFGVPASPPPPGASPAAALPDRARWPDAFGQLLEDAPASPPGASEAVRNPWIPRVRPRAPKRSAVFIFGGYIAGGADGPVGIVNGRSVRRGDAIGDFVVERVVPMGVVLERAGGLYVVPPGTRTAITLRDP